MGITIGNEESFECCIEITTEDEIEEVDLGEDTTTCDESVILDAGDGYGSYLWSTGETTQTIVKLVNQVTIV